MYKIPQDVEADDKFLGPLSFKQFIFIGIAAVSSYMSFLSLTKGFWPVLIFFFPLIVVSGFLGFPWGRDQSTEVWLAARIRFMIKPHIRIWNQSGVKELVTITAPKKIDKLYTDGLDKNEVKSRLSGLATLLDSRGWAVKNVTADTYSNPYNRQSDGDDRLLGVDIMPQQVIENIADADVLDETTNNTALKFDQMIKSSEEKHHQDILSKMQAVRNEPVQQDQPALPQQNADFWFLQQDGNQQGGNGVTQQPAQSSASLAPQAPLEPAYTTFQAPAVVNPYTQQAPSPKPTQAMTPSLDEEALLQKIHKQQAESSHQYGHLKTIQPLSEQSPTPPPKPSPLNPSATVTPPVNPAIINLANNDDLNIATLARQAGKNQDLSNGDEVVISLHNFGW